MRNIKSIVVLFLILPLLSSCEFIEIFNKEDDLTDFIASVKAGPKRRIEPDPTIPNYEPHSYVRYDRNSPFQPLKNEVAIKQDPNCKVSNLGEKTFMQEYSLTSFKYVGLFLNSEKDMVNSDKSKSYGLIKIGGRDDIFKIKKGDIIGENYGEVKEIYSNAIEVVEKISDGMGGYVCHNEIISLDLNN